MHSINKSNKYVEGFTLIEVIIVVAILGVIAAIAIPIYSQFVAKSYKTNAVHILETLPVLMEQRRSLTGWLCNNCGNVTTANSNNNYPFKYEENDSGVITDNGLILEYPNFAPKPASDQGNPIPYHYDVTVNVTCGATDGECQETATLTATPQTGRGAPSGVISMTYQ